ncbi:MAG: hypothetical protein WKG01_16975 [Kofleriaceae bacterium]
MERSFWEDSWRAGRINFHEGEANKYLSRHAARLQGRAVLVPMCGKSEDLAYLAYLGHEVIGIELVEDAVTAFFAEHGINPIRTPRGPVVEYRDGPIKILAGDLFAVTPEHVGTVDALYDRAALIALPPEMRGRYVDHLRLLAPGANGLCITLEYSQEQMAGPPFSVLESELRAHYRDRVELVDEAVADRLPPRAKDIGLAAQERCFAVTL